MSHYQNDQDHSSLRIGDFNSSTELTNNGSQEDIGNKGDYDEYNPYEHRHLEHPNSYTGALIHLLKTSLGTGILAVPLAFSRVGYGFGVIATVLIGLLCIHTITLLVLASQRMCRQNKVPLLSFPETVEIVIKNGPTQIRSWSIFSRRFVEIGLVLTYLFTDSVYSVFVGTSLKEVVDFYFPEASDYGLWYYSIGQMIPLIFLCQIRPLKYLVPFSMIANCSMVVAFGILFYYMFKANVDIDISERDAFKDNIIAIPHFISTIVFAMEGIGAIMPLENSMNKKGFLGCHGVLNIALSVIVVLYTTFGFVGYYAYGDGTKASIISNLPSDKADEWQPHVSRACIALAVFLSFMLQFYIPIDITWKNVKPYIPKERRNIAQISMRAVGVIFAIGVGLAVPDLSTLIALVGAVFYSTLGLFVPPVIDTIIKWDGHLGRYNWILIKNILICIFALCALVFGSYFAILELVTGKKEVSVDG